MRTDDALEPARRDSDEGLHPATARALRHRMATAQRAGRVPSVVGAMARRGEPVWFGTAGTPDPAGGPPATAETQYRIGSITKTLVAVCVLRLVERGEVDLADPIGQHLPDAPAPDSTVRELLGHTAGLASETPPPWWERTAGDGRPGLADVLSADPRRHPRGATFHYSNPGFALLGALVAAREGRPWFDVLHDAVLAPLGMTRTTYHPSAPHAAGWAVHPWADVVLPEPAHDHGLLAAAGQVWSTPGDLCRFGVFLAGDGEADEAHAVLDPELLELMRAPHTAPREDDWSGSYGLGVQHFRIDGHVYLGHSGSMPGFLAMLISSPADGLTVAVQSNAWSELAVGQLAADLAGIVRDREPTMPLPWRAAEHARPDAFELVGPWYWGAVAMSLTLRADGDLEIGGIGARGRAARFRRSTDGRWIGRSGYYHGEFLEPRRDAAGAITHLDLGSFVLTREPYAPGEVVPGGLDLGSWQL